LDTIFTEHAVEFLNFLPRILESWRMFLFYMFGTLNRELPSSDKAIGCALKFVERVFIITSSGSREAVGVIAQSKRLWRPVEWHPFNINRSFLVFVEAETEIKDL